MGGGPYKKILCARGRGGGGEVGIKKMGVQFIYYYYYFFYSVQRVGGQRRGGMGGGV